MPASKDWKETLGADEDARFTAHAESLRAIQRAVAKGARPSRALHAKGLAGLEATFEVLDGLPSEVAQGLFAKPATYAAYVRFSNGASVRQPDRKGDVRGVAIKLLGVEGEKLIPGLERATTQDFLMIKTAATPFRHVDEFVALVVAAQNPLLLLPRLIGRLGLGRALGILPKLAKGLGQPIASLATTRFYSALPIQWGPYAAHYSLVPTAAPPAGARTPADLGAELAERLRAEPVTYDFAVQLYVDDVKTPIEDASVEWLAEDAPWIHVGRLRLAPRDARSARAEAIAERVETLSFDPWHALREHRPLGNMMRARNVAYRLSTEERKAAGEPEGREIA